MNAHDYNVRLGALVCAEKEISGSNQKIAKHPEVIKLAKDSGKKPLDVAYQIIREREIYELVLDSADDDE